MLDYSIQAYKLLFSTLVSKEYSVIANDNSDETQKQNLIILRHDIDAKPLKALAIAKVENSLDIISTYFFKINPTILNPQIVKQIISLNHCIGYHYEDLVRNHGNFSKAISDFEKNLDNIRKLYPVTTICADGDPLSKYNNLWLWDKYDYKRFGIESEISLDIDYNEYAYYTDTGRSWDGDKYNVWDHVKTNKIFPQFHSTFDIIDAVEKGVFPEKAVINIHPQRWTDNILDWTKELIFQKIKNNGKYLIVKFRK